ncbi:hypothetical protein WJX81_000673 [Elliptochloris bilobata]|uniref:Uncharacterized protein n=1 Tax=Elliptochloris bilobata TaxID=381761 RepID=A0AAW1RXI3_9CHLO
MLRGFTLTPPPGCALIRTGFLLNQFASRAAQARAPLRRNVIPATTARLGPDRWSLMETKEGRAELRGALEKKFSEISRGIRSKNAVLPG